MEKSLRFRKAFLFLLALSLSGFARGGMKGAGLDPQLLSADSNDPSNGLVMAYILDDGNADVDDWVTANSLTFGVDTSSPIWAAANDGLTFDGTADYATFTPPTNDWMSGYTMAIQCTVPNTSFSSVIYMDVSADPTDQRLHFGSQSSVAYNRPHARWGRNNDANNLYLTDSTASSAKQYYITEYNDDLTADLYTDDGTTPVESKSNITEYQTVNPDRGALGSNTTQTAFCATTIYRVMIWNRPLTQAERILVMAGWTPTHD